MSVPDRSKALTSLLARLRAERPETPAADERAPSVTVFGDSVLLELVRSFFLWESTTSKSATALARLGSAFIDLNEFRVSLVPEMAAAAGLPRGEERMRLLKSALNEIFRREHALRLGRLIDLPKRESRAYLDGLPGVPAFVAARTFAVALGGHAVPVDERLRSNLIAAGVLDEGVSLEEAAGQLERACRSGEAAEVHALLQRWSDDGAPVVPTKNGKPKAARSTGKRDAAPAKKRATTAGGRAARGRAN